MLLRSGTYYETTEIGFKFTIKASATIVASILATFKEQAPDWVLHPGVGWIDMNPDSKTFNKIDAFTKDNLLP